MLNASEVNAKLDAHMLQQDKRLKRIEVFAVPLTTHVQASITALRERTDKGKEVAHKNHEVHLLIILYLYKLQQHGLKNESRCWKLQW